MAELSYVEDRNAGWSMSGVLDKLKKSLASFWVGSQTSGEGRIWHGKFSYKLVPGTAIRSIHDIAPVTSIDAGNCYVCIFDRSEYSGNYRIIGPGEKIRPGECRSLVISSRRIPVDPVRRKGKAPEDFWELDGPMYIMHFSSLCRIG